ncbi:MAG: diguanylate cyclase [Thermodesulfobacteriota bacterium]|nr:diguanylate cyclase [Thermodesulfobacteriota bacterium]
MSAEQTGMGLSFESLKDISVLFVEDDPLVLEQIVGVLGKVVGKVHNAQSSQIALRIYNENEPDIVIVDISSPVVDGLEIATAIRNIDNDVLIIAICDVDKSNLIINAVEKDIDTFLFRPILPELLIDTIQKGAKNISFRKKFLEDVHVIQHLLDAYPIFVLMIKNYQVTHINSMMLKYLGYENFEDFERSGKGIQESIVEIDGQAYSHDKEEWIRAIVDDPLDREHVLHIINPRHPSEKYNAYVAAFNRLPVPGRCLITLTDVTAFEDEKRGLEDQASTDPLTGVLNRRKFMALLRDEERRISEGGLGFSLIMFDIDHFKSINDRYGHDVGDSVLREITNVAQNNVRGTDRLCRWGGEEFMVLAAESDVRRARRVAERLRRKIEAFDFTGVPTVLTSSFGVAQYTPGEDLEVFIKRVDEALYKAKQGGRNRVEQALEPDSA